MSAPFDLSETVNLGAAVIIGLFFGFFLERGGMGDPHKLTGVFFRTDFALPKMMLSAILVATTGLCLLSDLKVLDMSRVWIIPTYLWPQLVGGALFGLGYLVSGYCPSTAAAGLASGRLDALITMVGIGIGTLLFSALYPALEGFYKTSDMGTATLPELLHINHWALLALLYVFAGIMFYAMEWYERRRQAAMANNALHTAS